MPAVFSSVDFAVNVEEFLCPLLDWNPFPTVYAVIAAGRTNQFILCILLQDMGNPAASTGNGKNRGEDLRIQPDTVQDQGRVELHVGLERVIWFVGSQGLEDDILYLARIRVKLHIPGLPVQLLGCCPQHISAWVARAVHTMSKAHKAFVRGQFPVYPLGSHILNRLSGSGSLLTNLEHHIHRRAGRSSMQRAFQGTDSSYHC